MRRRLFQVHTHMLTHTHIHTHTHTHTHLPHSWLHETNIYSNMRACHHIHTPSDPCSHTLGYTQTHQCSKWKPHSCSLYRGSVTVGEHIKAHTPRRSPTVALCVCVWVCVSQSDWWIFKEEHGALCLRRSRVDVFCHQRGKDWLPPFFSSLSCSIAAWRQQSHEEKVRECENSTDTQTHTNTGNVFLLPKLRRRSTRRWADCVIVHVFAHVCVCVLVTEIWLVALSTCPCIHHGEKWLLPREWRGAVINQLANQ